MSYYVLTYPTILLLVTLSTNSSQTTVAKLVSESLITKNNSPRKILTSSIIQSLIISIIIILITLPLVKFISFNFLKNTQLIFPLILGICYIPFVGISDALRGYFMGKKEFKTSSTSTLIEQLTRTLASIIFVYMFYKKSYKLAASYLYIGLIVGEICSILYCLTKLNKIEDYKTTNHEFKNVFNISILQTSSKLIGSIIYFIEPIIYTIILSNYYDTNLIHTTYTIIDSFILPTLTMFSFLMFTACQVLLPTISSLYAKKEFLKTNKIVNKVLYYITHLSFIIALFYFFNGSFILSLLYKTKEHAILLKIGAFPFIFYYLSIICHAILNAIGKIKQTFFISTILNITKLIFIIIFLRFKSISLYAIFLSTIIIIIIQGIIYLYFVIHEFKLRIKLNNVFKELLILLLLLISLFILNIYINNFVLNLIVIFLYTLILFFNYLKDKQIHHFSYTNT